jgi:hypothetical protein
VIRWSRCGTWGVTTGIKPVAHRKWMSYGLKRTHSLKEQDPLDSGHPRGRRGAGQERDDDVTDERSASKILPPRYLATIGESESPATTGYPQRDSNPRSPA